MLHFNFLNANLNKKKQRQEIKLNGSAANLPARLPSLDGLRTLSIAIVIIGHSFIKVTTPDHGFAKYLSWVVFNGRLGVCIFFVISGFLITWILRKELEATSTISLKKFYLGRVLRIFPAYYFYILVVLVGFLLGWIELRREEILSPVFFYHNYLPTRQSWWLEHVWSLNVEEQFYFFWPLILLYFKPKRAGWIALSIIMVNPLIRWISHRFVPGLPLVHTLHSNLDYLMAGCWVGLMFDQPWFRRAVALGARFHGQYLAAAFVFVLSPLIRGIIGFHEYLHFEGTLVAPCIAFFVIWCVLNPETFLGKIFNRKSWVYIGTLSYSIYLWQQPFMPKLDNGIIGYFPLNLIPIGFLAWCSYQFLEVPLLKFRSRLRSARIKSLA
ncbi:MAG: hypothetical protein C5B49_04510 [Bdellovibrio sp.]|nr:MAG: hypothetical protein C5B49_04510 [Bdellovibrio sp.]